MNLFSFNPNYFPLYICVFSAFFVYESLANALIQEASDDSVNQQLIQTKHLGLNAYALPQVPVQNSTFCKFGRVIPGTCKCNKKSEPICGSDLENYANTCEFLCAQMCNPGLDRFEGACSKDGGPPKRHRLDFSRKKTPEEPMGSPSMDDDEPEIKSGRSAGDLSRSFGGSGLEFMVSFGRPENKAAQESRSVDAFPGFPMDSYLK